MTRRVRGSVWLPIVALVLLVLAACGQDDPRAYSGNEGSDTFEGAMREFHLAIPNCEIRDVHYFGAEPPTTGSSLYVTFAAADACMAQFLVAIAGSEEQLKRGLQQYLGADIKYWEGHGLKFGWTVNVDHKYDWGSFGVGHNVSVEVLVDVSDIERRLFLVALAS